MYVSDSTSMTTAPNAQGRHAKTVISVHGVKKSYGGINALKGVDLEIAEGQVFGIIGPNGAGKSTLFDVMCGITVPTEGEVRLFDRSIGKLAPYAVARLGVARSFQRTAVFADASVLDNLRFACQQSSGHSVFGRLLHTAAWKRDEKSYESRAFDVAQLTGLWADRDRAASTLSYGEQRRLAVAIALMTEPKLLFLDEPAAGMDDNDSADFIELVKHVSIGRTVVIVEHDMAVIRALCDRCLVMADGEPLVHGIPDDVFKHPKVVEAYLGVEHD